MGISWLMFFFFPVIEDLATESMVSWSIEFDVFAPQKILDLERKTVEHEETSMEYQWDYLWDYHGMGLRLGLSMDYLWHYLWIMGLSANMGA